MTPSRRDVLAAAGTAVALAGCTEVPTGPSDGSSPPAEPPGDSPADSPGGGRPTATARDPESVTVSGAWPQRGNGPGHGGVTAAAGVPDEARVYWHLRRVRSGPAVLAGGRLFHQAKLGEDGGGRPTRTRTREPDAGTAHPVYGAPHLVARDAADGAIEWTAPLDGRGAGWPTVADGTVVASTGDRVVAHDASDGSERWAVTLGERPVGDPTVADGVVVVPSHGVVDGGSGEYVHEPAVQALDLSDGTERWTVEPPARGLGVGVAGDAVVVVAHDFDGSGSVRARSLVGGAERWRTDLTGEFAFQGPVLAGDLAHVADSGGTLYALSLAEGEERWTAEGASGGLAADEDAVYVAGRRRLAALDAAGGDARWTAEFDGESLVAPAVGGDVVYAGGSYADLHAVDAATGERRWSASFPSQVVEGDMVMSGPAAQPTVADGAVYAFAADGLYAFGPADAG